MLSAKPLRMRWGNVCNEGNASGGVLCGAGAFDAVKSRSGRSVSASVMGADSFVCGGGRICSFKSRFCAPLGAFSSFNARAMSRRFCLSCGPVVSPPRPSGRQGRCACSCRQQSASCKPLKHTARISRGEVHKPTLRPRLLRVFFMSVEAYLTRCRKRSVAPVRISRC